MTIPDSTTFTPAGNPLDPRYEPQSKPPPSASEAMPRGPLRRQRTTVQKRHTILNPHAGSVGHSNPNDTSSNTEPQGHRGLDNAVAQAPSYTPLPGTNADDASESESQQARQAGSAQGSGMFGNFFARGKSALFECKECKVHKETIAQMEAKLRKQQFENERLTRQCDDAEHRANHAEHELHSAMESIRSKDNKLSGVHQELENAKVLSHAREKELLESAELCNGQRMQIQEVTEQRNQANDRAANAERELRSAIESIRLKDNELSGIHQELENAKVLWDTCQEELLKSDGLCNGQRIQIQEVTQQRDQANDRADDAARKLRGAIESIRLKDDELSTIRTDLENTKALSNTRGKERMIAELRNQGLEVQKLAQQRDQAKDRADQAERQLQSARESIRSKDDQLSVVHKELDYAKELSDTRAKELLGSQAFLSKADSISVSELIDLTQTLNAEIFQAVASVSESFEHAYMEEDVNIEGFLYLEAIIGNPITRFVATISNMSEVNSLSVQIALQALISAFCVSYISKWDYASKGTNNSLKKLYQTIRQTENHAVSGRWRALTRARLRPDTNSWTNDFLNDFRVILRLAKWNLAEPALKDAFLQDLLPVFAAANKLRIALGEQFTSADIEVFLAQPSMPFNARDVEDDWGDARAQSSSKGLVAGTTGVGLRRLTAHDGTDETASYDIILPPKIILVTTLEEIVEPRPKCKKVSRGGGW